MDGVQGVDAAEPGDCVIELTNRYDALGVPLPDPDTMCLGRCEGTGWVLIPKDEMEEPWRSMWLEAEAKEPVADGWHEFVCPDCKGTRLRA